MRRAAPVFSIAGAKGTFGTSSSAGAAPATR
jgi:hypothetical protein